MGRPEKLCATCALLRSQLDSLHKRIRALAVDCGAVQTEDAVEDVRRAMEGMREVVSAAKAMGPVFDDDDSGPNECERAVNAVIDAARRLAAARGEKS